MKGHRKIRACDRQEKDRAEYLGDGVYAYFDGYGVWLTAEDGIQATDAIYLEMPVFDNLREFWTRQLQRAEGERV